MNHRGHRGHGGLQEQLGVILSEAKDLHLPLHMSSSVTSVSSVVKNLLNTL